MGHLSKLALMNGQTLTRAFVPLPGGTQAVYNPTVSKYRSPDTPHSCAASSRVVRLICAPLPLWPHLLTSGDSDANTGGETRDRSARQSAPLPPARHAPAGCPAW